MTWTGFLDTPVGIVLMLVGLGGFAVFRWSALKLSRISLRTAKSDPSDEDTKRELRRLRLWGLAVFIATLMLLFLVGRVFRHRSVLERVQYRVIERHAA